jgi:hypothetical protein
VTRTRTLRAALSLAGVALLVAGLAACGGDDGDKPDAAAETTASASGDAGGLVVTDGVDPDDLLACLTDADLPATMDDATPWGVDVPTQGIEVAPLDGWDGDQGAQLWVFTDPQAAADNRAIITLSDEDTPTSRIAGNVIVHYYAVPERGDQQLAALDACLPA